MIETNSAEAKRDWFQNVFETTRSLELLLMKENWGHVSAELW